MYYEIMTGESSTNELISITIENNERNIIIKYLEDNATICNEDWEKFIEQVNERKIVQWREDRLPYPIGSPNLVEIAKRITTTTSKYQLFLASIDIALHLDFPNILEPSVYFSTADLQVTGTQDTPDEFIIWKYIYDKLNGVRISLDGSLIIFPENYYPYANNTPLFLEQLLRANKLGKISFYFNGRNIHNFLYKPYLTPLSTKEKLDDEVKSLLNKIYKYIK